LISRKYEEKIFFNILVLTRLQMIGLTLLSTSPFGSFSLVETVSNRTAPPSNPAQASCSSEILPKNYISHLHGVQAVL
jgi:hypothetical protein